MGTEPLQSPQPPLFPLAQQSALPATRTLPPQPSLEQLKKQAKELLAAARAGDRTAQERLRRFFSVQPATRPVGQPEGQAAKPPTLSQAQLVVAREHGFPSWARLRREVQLAPLRAQLERCIERPIDWSARRNAMQTLAEAGPSGMLVALEALAHPDPRLRGAALGFIDRHATSACVPQLTQVAPHDPVPDVRRAALHALLCERCKPEPLQIDVLPLLIRMFREDANRRVRFTAAVGLFRQAGEPRVQAAFRAAAQEDPSALVRRAAIGKLRGDDAPPLLAHVAQEDPSALVRRAAIGRLRGDDAPPLLAHVAQRDPDPHVRVAAASRLGGEPHRQLACQVLEAVLRGDASLQVKREAHLALKLLSPEYRQLAAQRAREANLARAAQQPGAA
jgi:hypothetical protein